MMLKMEIYLGMISIFIGKVKNIVKLNGKVRKMRLGKLVLIYKPELITVYNNI